MDTPIFEKGLYSTYQPDFRIDAALWSTTALPFGGFLANGMPPTPRSTIPAIYPFWFFSII
jgi:hypothetical protein